MYSLSTEIEMNEWPSKYKNNTRELDKIIDGSVKSISFRCTKFTSKKSEMFNIRKSE